MTHRPSDGISTPPIGGLTLVTAGATGIAARRVLKDTSVDLFADIRSLHQALDYHLERHNILVSNVSNVDTPNYVPRDLARTQDAGFSGVLNVTLNRTNAAHIALPESGAPMTGRVFDDPSAGAGNDRNFVSLDREAAKVAANNVRYDVISTLVASELGGLTFAANDGHSG